MNITKDTAVTLSYQVTTPEGKPVVPVYEDQAFARGVTAHRPYTGGDLHPSTAWHAQFEDVNNDGLADLFVAKGNVSGSVEGGGVLREYTYTVPAKP